ncbi:hypothetical protein ACIBHY_08130 [Nonomuraea sp. NPDC050547]|uniref:hypothetical protein n=1 Tax=unclassified Nonomuraea TaxID=2593643 RepID=UPI0037ADF2FC
MMRRLAAAAAAAALGTAVLATATPAMAEPPGLGFDTGDYGDGGNTRLSFDANPEPVWKGSRLTLEGKLSVQCDEDYINGYVQVFNADHCREGSWYWLGGKRITILFKPNYSGRWHYVDTVRTDNGGYFHTGARAWTSGTWKAVFEGSRYLEGSAATDWVRVVRH